ncbi:MAG: response regulator [Deltaproteobacteria bacterium]|nr:MAG: response regulator [Deltaproteobacteria bacterium]
MNRDMLSRRLQRKGFRCLVAEDGVEALDILEKEPEVQLVLLDVMMPRMNGLEVVQTMRSSDTWKDTPILMVSARVQNTDIDKAMDAGANGYITKPIDFKEALKTIRGHLEGRV